MTERLSQLLHEEATHLRAPVPDPATLALDGRRLRRRQQLTTGLAAAAAIAIVAGGATAVWQEASDQRPPQVAAVPPDAVVYGWQDQVHIGDMSLTVPGSVADVDLTARGVLVTSQDPDTLTLVRSDGTTVDLGPPPEQSAVATDPEADVYVHTEERDDGLLVVARDLDTGEVIQEIPALEQLGRTGARAGISYDDGIVYLQVNRPRIFTIELATGDISHFDLATTGFAAVREGRAVVDGRDTFRVVDVTTGEAVLTVQTGTLVNASLSPDARWFLTVRDTTGTGIVPLDQESPPEVTVYAVDSGAKVVLDQSDSGIDWAWTLAGDLYRIDGEDVVRCDPADWSCQRSPAPEPVPAYGHPAIPRTPSW